jgi:hypothetical protein
MPGAVPADQQVGGAIDCPGPRSLIERARRRRPFPARRCVKDRLAAGHLHHVVLAPPLAQHENAEGEHRQGDDRANGQCCNAEPRHAYKSGAGR